MRKLFLLIASALCIAINAHANNNTSYPSGEINDFWVEHNAYYNGYKGMIFHIEMDVNDYQGGQIMLGVYIMDDDGYPVQATYSTPASFKTRDGHLCTYNTTYVKYECTHWDNVTFFLPYCYLPCFGDYQCEAQIFTSQGEYLCCSTRDYFSYGNNY
jgi:hypothetical protein